MSVRASAQCARYARTEAFRSRKDDMRRGATQRRTLGEGAGRWTQAEAEAEGAEEHLEGAREGSEAAARAARPHDTCSHDMNN